MTARQYRILGVLGRGGFGTVYRADLVGEGGFVRPVALKVLNPEMDGLRSLAERLRDEARILGQIRHRAVVKVDGLIQLDGRWTIVMEYVEGVDLAAVVQAGPVPARAAMELLGEVAAGLHAVASWSVDGEAFGLVHRDVKPHNLLLTAAGEVKLVDFGVARVAWSQREARTQGMRFGSPGYIAPERVDGDDTPAGDVFGMGVVLFELLAGDWLGRAPFRKAQHEAYVADAILRLTGPEAVIALVREMLAYEPALRPSAREVERRCRELSNHIEGPFLRDWAEQVLPPLLAARRLQDASGAFSGPVVSEGVPTGSTAPAFEVGGWEALLTDITLVGGVAALVVAGGLAIVGTVLTVLCFAA